MSDLRAGTGGPGDALPHPRAVEAAEVIRSEERLRVATETVAVGRARLVKYVVTEDVTFTVPVSREEIRLEIDQFPDHEQEPTGATPTPDVYEVVRHEEQMAITTQVVAVERVRMIRHVRTADHVVHGDVRAERVDVEHVAPAGHAPPR
jgi:uncharacterized protein (TIGR02271 family)